MGLLNRRSLLCAVGVVVLASLPSAQDHGYTPADVENGTRLYQASCAGCHGPNGDGIPGIDLGFAGYIAHEYRPSPGRDPVENLRRVLEIMDI